jgi:hypothetical protein
MFIDRDQDCINVSENGGKILLTVTRSMSKILS